MRVRRGAVPLALAVAATGVTAMPAHAVVSTIYVQNGSYSNCSDNGVGSSAVPYCTISKAASVVQPGQTVIVGSGSYDETVTITAKGTAAAPIRFVGQSTPQFNIDTWVGSNGGGPNQNHAFVLNGAQYVTIAGFAVSGDQGSVLVQNAQHVTLDKLQMVNERGSTPDVSVTGSSGVTLSDSWLEFGIDLRAGTSGTTIVGDQIPNGWYDGTGGILPAIRATDATATTVESNTITSACTQGIDLEGASTGAVIANNIIETAGNASNVCGTANTTAITVAPTATSGTTSDYNLVHPDGSETPYVWNGTGYATVSAFTAATGQAGHDLAADPKLVTPPGSLALTSAPYYPSEGSPEVDSGDAAHAPSTDILGLNRVDDPLVANTGSGSGYLDRGAFEYQDPIALVPMSVKHVAAGSPLDTSISTGVSAAWSKQITYTYDFGDGSPQKVETSGVTDTVTHDFARAGYERLVVTANDGYAGNAQEDQNSYFEFLLGADYTPMNPTRMLDTRKGIGAPATAVAPNSDVTLTVGGVDGIPTTGLAAVAMNVTVTQPTMGGYLTVYPHGQPSP